MRANGGIFRRRDLLGAGFSDAHIKNELGRRRIFRVRHGWYMVPDSSEQVVHAVRVGGRITGLAALRALQVPFLPPSTIVDIVVPRGAAHLRHPRDRTKRFSPDRRIRLNWIDRARYTRSASDWIVSEDEALLCVLRKESREIAVSCCDALVRYRGWTNERLDRVFQLAPARVQRWRHLIDGRADAWGETVVRLRVHAAGIPFEPQFAVRGAGRYDGRVFGLLLIEVDGKQHDESWDGLSSFEKDHDRDLVVLREGGRVIRITYRQLAERWAECLETIRVAYEAARLAS